MGLSSGTRLGPYEILAPLGAGGMGEVWKARDTRVDRQVALKVLPEDFLEGKEGGERRERFEREAKLLASLNHPNVAVLYSFEGIPGSSGAPTRHILTMELLEGETLRSKLGAPLPPRKAIEYAVQTAQGLAAAHEKGIVHRDLKPENLFVTKDGRIKILDFGIAKLAQLAPPGTPLTEVPTLARETEPGVVMGTVAYMSPEQVLGKHVDARSDLFSLGVVLYEMLSGERPFQKETVPETMAAILKAEPPDLFEFNKTVPLGLDRIVRHCLEKEPTGRFQSARDLVFALESLSQATPTLAAPPPTADRSPRPLAAVVGAAAIGVCVVGAFIWGKNAGRTEPASFKRITLQRGIVASARFTPDLQSVVYSAAWDGRPQELFVQRLASPDARSLGVVCPAGLAIAGTAGGDVAVVRFHTPGLRSSARLERVPLEGGTPRPLLDGLLDAAWDRAGSRFAVVKAVAGGQRLEYPVGNVLIEAVGLEQIASPSLSPDGSRIAYVFWPVLSDPTGDVCVVDVTGRKRTLSTGWYQIADGRLGWSPDGSEIWFSATRSGFRKELHAVTLSGQERLVARMPGNAVLEDIAPDGRVLVAFGQTRRFELRGRMAQDSAERDLSWLDGTFTPLLSADGRQMIFQEWGEGGSAEASVYHRRMDGSAPTRLGEGTPVGVSPDWTTALAMVGSGDKMVLKLLPIGAGETRTLPRGPVRSYHWGFWPPKGWRIVITGSDGEGQLRLFRQDVEGGLPVPIGRLERVDPDAWLPFTSDGRFIAIPGREGEPFQLCPVEGGEALVIPFLKAGETPIVFGDDGASLFFSDDVNRVPVHVQRLDLRTGRRDPWLELAPPDRAGVTQSVGPWLTPNGRFYAYSYQRILSDLYVVEGLK